MLLFEFVLALLVGWAVRVWTLRRAHRRRAEALARRRMRAAVERARLEIAARLPRGDVQR